MYQIYTNNKKQTNLIKNINYKYKTNLIKILTAKYKKTKSAPANNEFTHQVVQCCYLHTCCSFSQTLVKIFYRIIITTCTDGNIRVKEQIFFIYFQKSENQNDNST